jgi:hypothetical protein
MPTISPLGLAKNGKVETSAPTADEVRGAAQAAANAVLDRVEALARAEGGLTFREAEHEVRDLLFALGRAVMVLFLALREEHVMVSYPAGDRIKAWGRSFRRAPAIPRNLTTAFGVVRYWRTYMREAAEGERRGFHPLDLSLGLTADRFSWNVLTLSAWLATKMSFAEARDTLARFLPSAPSKEVFEKIVLGLGRFTEDWFKNRPAPENDGDVLIIMPDGKAIPTALEEELQRRRGKRKRSKPEHSPRHRGRKKRGRHPKKPRRSKGDASKNGKSATLIVMYTLRREDDRLVGPINKWVYASFAPKEHAFRMARLEANKRGFTEGSGKLVQIVSDGDNDFATLAKKYFASALHTIDFWHVVEYLWEAGRSLFDEGSKPLHAWVKDQEGLLFEGKVGVVLDEMKRRLAAIPKSGPGNKGRRERLAKAISYIDKRRHMIDYGNLRRRDLEIATGPVEGAIKHVIGRRQDHGGMRWIAERAEAVLKLRCIEVMGDWDRFERSVHDQLHHGSALIRQRFRLQQNEPQPLPHLLKAA